MPPVDDPDEPRRDVELEGRSALVTGGASGIGRASARRLASAGSTVVIADVDTAGGKDAAAEVGGLFIPLDVADPDAWTGALHQLEAEVGALHIAFLNAGVATGEGDITRLRDDQYRRILGVNLDGVVYGARSVVPTIERAGGGAIVATASMGGLTPMPDDPVYSATKHAVVGLVRSLARQLEAKGITINALCPAFTDTAIVTPELRAAVDAFAVPLIEPAVVAEAVVRIVTGGGTGEAWYCQVGRECGPYEFRGVPGPRL